jgi:hypothetical protein
VNFPFTRDRYRHELLERAGDVCLVARTNLVTDSMHWEVVVLQHRRAETSQSGRTYPAREVYPGAEQWGTAGWTYTDLMTAREKWRYLASTRAKEARHASGM